MKLPDLLMKAAMTVLAFMPSLATAQSDAPFKFTTGVYQVAPGGGLEGGTDLDINLRYSRGGQNAWIGWFRSPVLGFNQWRAGWDNRIPVGPVILVPSVQVASGGFVGGSGALEVGRTWFGGAGLGRTNLRTYANLNFDPNDAWFVYGGYRYGEGRSIQLQLIRDNRENPDQQHLHLLWRHVRDDGERWTVDLLFKQGTVEERYIRRLGLSVGYDWARWFARVAWDPLVNFTPQDMLRLSVGRRF